MKYAIRISRLPPAVIYATVARPPAEVVTLLNRWPKDGVFAQVARIMDLLNNDVLCACFQLVEDTSIVFTDMRDADVLITKTDTGFEVQA